MTAKGDDNDFNFLEIGRAAFDLSDRGVSGRSQPGPVDAFLYTDRGIYRPGETVELKPGSFHIMMTDLKQPVQRGKPFKATLKFEKAGDVAVDFAVEAAGATSAAASSGQQQRRQTSRSA